MPPILFVIFNRPSATRLAFESIRAARPSRLYVAADGPRPDRAGELAACLEARRIATAVDWPCKVETLFRDVNLGCKGAVASALDWFFECEEEGIIIEDDCVASQSFYLYAQQLLARYRHDPGVMAINGSNYQQGRLRGDASYYFSKYHHCWGWATWRRVWRLYQRDFRRYPAFKAAGGLKRLSEGRQAFVTFWDEIFSGRNADALTSWDYPFTLTCWYAGGLCVTPNVNLVTNIGFDDAATHTAQAIGTHASLPRSELSFPLKHPLEIKRDVEADRFTDTHHFRLTAAASLWRRVAAKWPILRQIRGRYELLRRI